jgi:DNA helicase-2/ATP-dependent DNA helicase PcrA
MSDSKPPAYLDALNDRQREAVLHTGGPLLILAGAGSGKTRVITTKIAYAIDSLGADPASILAVTFTNKAAAEMRERLAALSPRADQVLIKTFHAFGAWVLRRFGHEIGIDRRFLIYDDNDSLSLLKAELKTRYSPAQIRGYLSLIARAKDLGWEPDTDDRQFRKLTSDPGFADAYERYEKRLRDTGNLDFGDLILKTMQLLKGKPDVRERLRERFSFVLVDEYQDSNAAQFALLRELTGPAASLVVVGDDDQSIYGFRGAEVENILDFPEAFPGTTVIKLEQNYRSTRTILAAASAVVEHNERRMGKTLVTENEEGQPLRLALLGDYTEEALYAARLVERNPLLETAVLYRMNYQSRIFEEVFSRLGILYLLVGSVRFYEREEVKDTLAYLSLIVNPRDEVAARRVLNKPARGIGAKTEEKALLAARDAYGGDVLAACRDSSSFASGRAAEKLAAFAGLIDKLRGMLAPSPLTNFIHETIMASGLLGLYEERDKSEGTAKAKNLEELVNAAAPYGQGEEALGEFLENTLLKNPESGERADGRVTFITLHNTKGLEFDRVIISGLEEGVFPPNREGDGNLEEERRLFYVGLTRARRELYLTSCRSRLLYGQTIRSAPSRFLKEIPPELLVTEDLGGGAPTRSATGPERGAWPRGTRVHSDDYGAGWVEKSEVTEETEVVVVRFDTGRVIKILPRYHDLTRIHDE